MQDLQSIAEILHMRMPSMDFFDVMEILIITFLLYHIMIWIKNTRAWALLKGLVIIFAFLLMAAWFKMKTILWLAENILTFAVTALIVVLQPELRKALEELGNKNIISSVLPFDSGKREEGRFSDKTVSEIIKACMEMGKAKQAR